MRALSVLGSWVAASAVMGVVMGLAMGVATVLAIGIVAGAADTACAEIVELEVVGAIPLDAESRRRGIPKDRAIDEALWQGVSRVAADLIAENPAQPPEPEPGPDGVEGVDGVDGLEGDVEPEATEDPIREALGTDMVPYTRSFRIVEDQGERPVLFTDHPDAATEYVVVMAVHVDVDKLRERLSAAGLLANDRIEVLTGILLEIRGLTQYRGYDELVQLIESEAVGAASVMPLQLERGRALLQVEGEWSARELLDRLLAAASPQLTIIPVAIDESGDESLTSSGALPLAGLSSLVVAVQWAPPAPPVEEGDNPTSEAGGPG
jgi:hypothetical protein